MTPRRRLVGIGAFTLASALLLSACGGDSGDSGDSGETGASGPTDGIVSVNVTEPSEMLTPGMTREVGGGLVVDNIYSGLVSFDAKGEAKNEMAESIETDDNTTWTIKIQDGWTFSDGTPVTAESYVKAWKYAADLDNGQLAQDMFSAFKGYSAEKSSQIDVKADDDLTFTATLSQPTSDFELMLGYSAFLPLPDAYYDDPDAFMDKPISNGPYLVENWEHETKVELRPNPDYKGERTPQNGGIDLMVYTDENTQYNDLLGGNLDVITNVPSSAFATFEDDLGDRAVNQPGAVIQTVTVPEWLPEFQGDAGHKRRQAISMAIDRETITKTLFEGTRIPAVDFTSPTIPGFSEDLPGSEVLHYDADKAKQLWDEAESEDPVGADYTLQIASNADSDHQPWIDAVCNTIKKSLSIECEFKPYPTFDEFLTARGPGPGDGDVPGLFRAGWQADWPSMSNYLAPIYGTGAGSNDGSYSNKDFDAKLDEAAAAPSLDDAVKPLQEAQEILFKDLPGIPLWYQNTTGGYGENVDNVTFKWNSEVELYSITKSE